MLFFNLKIAIRNFIKNREFTIINIMGLAVGLAAFTIISLLIQFNLSFDKFNKNYSNIYRVDQDVRVSGADETYSCTPFPLAPILQEDFPEILRAARIRYCAEFMSTDREHAYYEDKGIYADSTLFDIFDFEFLQGDPKTALDEPMTLVLSEKLADKYFPGQNPVGKSLRFQTDFVLNITGVYRNPPANSTLEPEYIVSFSSFTIVMNQPIDQIWDWCMIATFILLDEGADPDMLQAKIRNILDNYSDNEMGKKLKLWPLAKIHLQYNDRNDERGYIYLMGLIAAFTLLIACINFMNLSTAYSSVRAREISLKKISGATRQSIIRQFLGESLIISFVSLMLAYTIAVLALPYINALINENLKIQYFNNPGFFTFIAGVAFLTGILSGSYPAFYLSRLIPVKTLKGSRISASKSPVLRRILVVFQFLISIILIICTIIIFQQVNYMKNKELGFDKENILVAYIQLTGLNNESRYDALKNNLLRDPRIISISWSHNAPFLDNEFWNVSIEGMAEDQKYYVNHNHVDFDFLKTYGIRVKEGRELSEEFPSDKQGACLVNEKAVLKFGWDSCGAIGKTIKNDNIVYTVIGVVYDFHQYSVAMPVEPYFMSYTTRELGWPNTHSVKIAANQDIKEMKKYITQKFQEYFPGDNIEFKLLDENFDERNYGFVLILGTIIGIFAILSITIAAVGLFGLVSFITKQRTKEIGIRKANGAMVADLFRLVVKEFIILLVIANVIAWPLAYFINREILKVFAYKIDIGIPVFIYAGVISIVITLITVSYQILKVAFLNPVDVLRYE
jgi:putative ABC transport system permease protein